MLNWSRASDVSAVSREVPMTKELLTLILEDQGLLSPYTHGDSSLPVMKQYFLSQCIFFLLFFLCQVPCFRSGSRLCPAAENMDSLQRNAELF